MSGTNLFSERKGLETEKSKERPRRRFCMKIRCPYSSESRNLVDDFIDSVVLKEREKMDALGYIDGTVV